MQVTVCNIGQVPSMILFKGATHVVTMLRRPELRELKMPRAFNKDNWLFLDMDDVINETADEAPQKEQVVQLLDWVKKLPTDAHLVIHCYAGVSRSTAACPNPVITKFADELLGANGELHAAAEEVANNKLLSLYGGNLTSRNRMKE